jgi:hypothetical protein
MLNKQIPTAVDSQAGPLFNGLCLFALVHAPYSSSIIEAHFSNEKGPEPVVRQVTENRIGLFACFISGNGVKLTFPKGI